MAKKSTNKQEMDKIMQEIRVRTYWSVGSGFAWLLFLAVWIGIYWPDYSVRVNLVVILVSLIVVGAINAIAWIPFGMSDPERWMAFKELEKKYEE